MADTRPITDRRVLAMAFPIVISNATVPILGAVDTGVVGQLGEAAPIGAVGIGAIILSSIFWVFGFLRMGTAGMVAQARGAGDAPETGALLVRALIFAVGAGVTLILLQGILFWGAFKISPASAEVETLARGYLSIRIWSAPAAIAVYGLTGWLIAMERMRSVLVVQLVMNGTNILLDLVFVLKFGWGVEGVAIATLIAEWSGAFLGLWLCREAFGGDQWRDWPRIFNPERLRRMAAVNTDIMIRSVLLMAGFVSFLMFSAGLGDLTLAANQILLQFIYITAYALDGFAFAAEALIGQALGAHQRTRLRQAAIMCFKWGAIMVSLLAACFALGGGLLIDIMTTAPDVRIEARSYLPWMVAAPLIGVSAWMLDGIFIGATRTADMRNGMLISTPIYFASIWLFEPLGNHGLWAALMIFFVARGVTLGFKYPALERAADSA